MTTYSSPGNRYEHLYTLPYTAALSSLTAVGTGWRSRYTIYWLAQSVQSLLVGAAGILDSICILLQRSREPLPPPGWRGVVAGEIPGAYFRLASHHNPGPMWLPSWVLVDRRPGVNNWQNIFRVKN